MSMNRRNFMKTMGLIAAGIAVGNSGIDCQSSYKNRTRYLFEFPTIPGQRYRFSCGMKNKNGWLSIYEDFVAIKKSTGIYALGDDEVEVLISDVALYNITPGHILAPRPVEESIFAIDAICWHPARSVEVHNPIGVTIKTSTTLNNRGKRI